MINTKSQIRADHSVLIKNSYVLALLKHIALVVSYLFFSIQVNAFVYLDLESVQKFAHHKSQSTSHYKQILLFQCEPLFSYNWSSTTQAETY